MKKNNRLLILYHSGAGSTKTVAEIYYEKLEAYSVDISPIDLNYNYDLLQKYDVFLFAFPTYHCSPSSSMMSFMKNMPGFNQPKKAFVFTTCGLYSGNALMEFIKACLSKNIHVNGYSVYRAPATDGVLLLPPIPFMLKFERNIASKIEADIKSLEKIIQTNRNEVSGPPFKLYTLLNYPNKVLGKAYKHKIKLLKDNCVNCNKCVGNCIRGCWHKAGAYPQYEGETCEFCFKCVHHCPKGALVLSEKTKIKPKLNEKFYTQLKEKIMNNMV